MAEEIVTAGGVIEQAFDKAERYLRPETVEIKDPVSGVTALATMHKDGLHGVAAGIFDEYLGRPRFRRGTANLTSLDSFIQHVNRFKSPESVVFACDDRTNPSLTAVLDYHPAGADSDPDFGKHRSAFKFPLSDEWKAWHKQDGPDNAMGMREFAEFLEDRIVDVEHPADISFSDEQTQDFIDKLGGKKKIASPTKLLELSTGLSINENAVITEETKLSSGEGHIVFQSEHVDASGMAVDIPSLFVLAIPVFRNGPYYRVVARLRYRVRGGVTFWYELWRTDRVFDHAFNEAVEAVKAGTELPLLLGSPE